MPTYRYGLKGGGGGKFPVGIELPDAYVFVDVPSRVLPAAEGDLWDPGGADTVIYRVMFNIVNNDAGGVAIAGVFIGREINSAGGLALPYFWMFDEIIPNPGESAWRGPFFIHGDDAIRGYAAVVNDASVHFDVRRIL